MHLPSEIRTKTSNCFILYSFIGKSLSAVWIVRQLHHGFRHREDKGGIIGSKVSELDSHMSIYIRMLPRQIDDERDSQLAKTWARLTSIDD